MPRSDTQPDQPTRKKRSFSARMRDRGVKLFDQATAPVRHFFVRKAGLTPMGEFNECDVFLDSYPKSGSTWLRILILGLVYGCDPELTPFELLPKIMPDENIDSYYTRFATPMYFKSHMLPRPTYRRVIYLIRDGRDTMVSFLHHAEAIHNKQIDFLDIIHGKNIYFQYDWHEHVETWLSNPYGAAMLVLKFEDLKTEPVPALQKVCEFLEIVRDRKFIERIVAGASFDNMRQKELRDGPPIVRWPSNKSFMRRGQVGSYQDEMPEATLAVFMEQAGNTLRKCGYID